MGEYEVGRDLQDLRSRIERLEHGCGCHGHHHGQHDHPSHRATSVGRMLPSPEIGIDTERKPVLWKAEKAFKMPPVFAGLLGYGHHLQFDSAQSKTWGCTPEPLVLFVNWDHGGTDELYRLTNQVLSVYRITDPNTGTTTASVVYSAQLIASGRGKFARVNYPWPAFNGTLRNAGGAALSFFSSTIDFNCQDNKPFNVFGTFAPAIYDLVNGATWVLVGGRVDGC